MPALIYSARITSLSEELVQRLVSAGFSVESCNPRDITVDGSLLVMPSKVVVALRPDSEKAETVRTFAGVPPAADMNGQFVSQAVSRSGFKTAVATELRPNPEVAPVVSVLEPEGIKVVATLTEVERRAVSRTKGNASEEIARVEPSQIVNVSSPEVSRYSKKILATKEQCYRVLQNPLSTVVALLMFAVIYRGLIPPSTTGSPRRTLHRPTSLLVLSSAKPTRQTVERVRRHLSNDNFVAEDFTNHFASHAQSGTTQHNPGIKHPQSDSTRKRIVVD
jgi:hypothetical protein